MYFQSRERFSFFQKDLFLKDYFLEMEKTPKSKFFGFKNRKYSENWVRNTRDNGYEKSK